MGVMRPDVQKVLASLQGIPTDIEPIFVTAEELAPSANETAQKVTARKRARANRN